MRFNIGFSPAVLELLRAIAPKVVIIGGAARVVAGVQDSTKDIDLLYNGDSDAAYEAIREAVRGSGLEFTSVAMGHFAIDDDGNFLELLPSHLGDSYAACRRDALTVYVDDVPLKCAQVEKVSP